MQNKLLLFVLYFLIQETCTYPDILEEPLLKEEEIQILSQIPKHWTHTTINENKFQNYTTSEFKNLISTNTNFWGDLEGEGLRGYSYNKDKDLPTTFDSGTQWPSCKHPIKNQEQCGSCWAFSSSSTLETRLCINDGISVTLSPQYQMDCDKGDYGCHGGYLDHAFLFLHDTGTVSEECDPYLGKQAACISKCKDNGAFIHYKCHGEVKLFYEVGDMMGDMVRFGPLQTGFSVYQDFKYYKGGVYHHVSGGFLGGHAVMVVGWGVEEGVDYWLVANSWGADWGLDGYFKIQRGDCGIDDMMVGCN